MSGETFEDFETTWTSTELNIQNQTFGNYSNLTSLEGSKYVLKYDAINFIDNASRVVSLTFHVVYFVIVFSHRKLMTINHFHMHHVNIIGLMVAIHYCCWINSVELNLSDPTANKMLCSLAEMCFGVFRFSRMYAVLVLAVHRVIAVFFVNSYKTVCESKRYTALSAVLVWVAGALVFIAGKYGGNTVPGSILCIDGSSPYLINSIIYYIVTSSFGFIIPFIIMVVFYKLITARLYLISARLHKNHSSNLGTINPDRRINVKTTGGEQKLSTLPSNDHQTERQGAGIQSKAEKDADNTSKTDSGNQKRHQGSSKDLTRQIKENLREKHLSKQFFYMNLLEAGTALALISLYITNTIPNFGAHFYWFRQISRAINLFFQASIPVATLMFHPFKLRLGYCLKKRISFF